MGNYHMIRPSLYLIDLDLERPGFRQFISSWLYQLDGVTVLVDPGPSATFQSLLKTLKSLNVHKIDLILLTHIHIDHAGAAGLLLKQYPMAGVICHPKAIPHLVDPARLWEGSLKVLGDLAISYGPVTSIPPDALHSIHDFNDHGLGIEVIEMPGHSPHHVCYRIGDILFIAEAAGVNIPHSLGNYLRLATPPVFIYEVYRQSLLKAAALQAEILCFGHYGFRRDGRAVFEAALQQLERWMEIVGQHARQSKPGIEQIVYREIMKSDPALSLFSELPADIQVRERYFCMNSIKGILDYFEKKNEVFAAVAAESHRAEIYLTSMHFAG
jgi:glyoxylase-like metal-dependent hydrolase (beta-lactamase superfamily II)